MSAWVRFANFFSSRLRRKRSALYRQLRRDMARCRVCDLGGSRHFWENMPDDLVPKDLTLLNVAEDAQAQSHTGKFGDLSVVIYDGKRIPYDDGHFDVLMCNSVIEHVPPADRRALCQEIRRVAKFYFAQTPAHSFPIEPHFVLPFIHWLPRNLGRRLVPFSLWAILSRPGRERMESYFDEVQLLNRREFESLFPGAEIHEEKLLGLVKSYTAYGPGSSVQHPLP